MLFRCNNTKRELNTYFAGAGGISQKFLEAKLASEVLEKPLQVLEIAHLHGFKCDTLLKAPDYDLELLLIQLDSSSHDHSPCIANHSLQT